MPALRSQKQVTIDPENLNKSPYLVSDNSSFQSVRITLEGVKCGLFFIEREKQNMVPLLSVNM